ncbi:hypothetical protein [Kitasatospora viridis]|uniref:DUF3592 domain-containing protein n=1 Tax=Kitasatospora viridis TaxID=281105 RepID=A0A561TV79_9ACTN|nr:hypothetical protein [Kitasatospora viridis]TWF91013.1 hypothetical protein FHX73_12125 [Kitasatospora viridis]
MDDTPQDWYSPGLPRLTEEQRRELVRAGFDFDRLRALSRSKYGVSQIRSVLLVFTTCYPDERPGTADLARIGEAWRLAGRRPGSALREQLAQRGLREPDPTSGSGGGKGGKGGDKAKPLLPRTRRRVAAGWALVLPLLLAQAALGLLDLGVGMVVGAVGLIAGWFLLVRRLVYGRRRAPRSVKVAYVLATLLLGYATAFTGELAVVLLGTHGTVRVAYSDTETGSHGTAYRQCYLDLPGGDTEPMRTTGSCPAPDGSPIDAYYMPGGDSPLKPVPASSAELERLTLLWGLPTALGLGLLGYAVLVSSRDLQRPAPRQRREPLRRAAPRGGPER